MGFQLGPWPLTLDDPEPSQFKIIKITRVKYFENGDRYDDGVNGSRIGNHPWSNISIMVYGIQQHWADTCSIERISCSLIYLSLTVCTLWKMTNVELWHCINLPWLNRVQVHTDISVIFSRTSEGWKHQIPCFSRTRVVHLNFNDFPGAITALCHFRKQYLITEKLLVAMSYQ